MIAQYIETHVMTEPPVSGSRIRTWPWWAGFCAMVGLTLTLSVMAYLEKLPVKLNAIPGVDKIIHVICAGGLVFFLDGAIHRKDVRARGLRIPLAAILVLVPVGIEEILQRFSPVRESSVWDYLADCAGVALFIALGRRLSTRRPVATPADEASSAPHPSFEEGPHR
jgi:VanZ family protein